MSCWDGGFFKKKEKRMIEEYLEIVEGDQNSRELVLFALSTCGWCRKARNFLDENKLKYSYVYVDLLQGDAQKEVFEEVKTRNPRKTFPTLVINGEEVLAGFNEDKYKEVLL
jgi:glutaredoxin-like protein NrdH